MRACVRVCVCVSLNSKDKFCLYDLIKILSSFLISVLVSGWIWWMNLPKLMAYGGSESARDNFGKFFQQF